MNLLLPRNWPPVLEAAEHAAREYNTARQIVGDLGTPGLDPVQAAINTFNMPSALLAHDMRIHAYLLADLGRWESREYWVRWLYARHPHAYGAYEIVALRDRPDVLREALRDIGGAV